MFANKYWTSKSSWCFPHLKKQKLALASKGRSIFLKWWNEVWNEIMRQDSCSALWTTVDLSITSEIQAALAGAPAPCHCQHSLCPRLSGLEWLSLSVIWVSWSHLGAVSCLLHSSQAEESNREQITRHFEKSHTLNSSPYSSESGSSLARLSLEQSYHQANWGLSILSHLFSGARIQLLQTRKQRTFNGDN